MNLVPRSIAMRARLQRRVFAPEFSVVQIGRRQLGDHLDPFLSIDHFAMAQPFFPPHPHAGFSAVTYMFPGSASGFRNRDSRGEDVPIRPGDLHWTAAGRGMLHEETPLEPGVVCDGLQIFVNLSAEAKWMPPEVLHLDAAQVPVQRVAGAEVRVVVGEHQGLASPLRPPTPVTLLDVSLATGARLVHAAARVESRFAYVVRGSVRCGDGDDAATASAGEAIAFAPDGDAVVLQATAAAHVVVAGGVPLREPVVFRGPFCMTSDADVERAVAAFHAGRMGELAPSFP